MNPNPEVKTLYSENFKKLKEKIEADTRWKGFPGIYIERKKTVKITMLPKAVYKFTAVLVKTPVTFFTDM